MPTPTPREHAAVVRHLLDLATRHPTGLKRQDGTRRVALCLVDAVVFRVLVGFHNYKTGQCDPCAATIAKAAGCSPNTALASVRRLAALGWLRIMPEQVRHPRKGLRWAFSYDVLAVRLDLSDADQETILAARCPRLLRAETIRIRANFARTLETRDSTLLPGCFPVPPAPIAGSVVARQGADRSLTVDWTALRAASEARIAAAWANRPSLVRRRAMFPEKSGLLRE